jgi:hypothetical protein
LTEHRRIVVFAALAVARHLQDATGVTIKKLVQTLRAARSATIEINGQRLTLDTALNHAERSRPGSGINPWTWIRSSG